MVCRIAKENERNRNIYIYIYIHVYTHQPCMSFHELTRLHTVTSMKL